jgi:putative ABC transport system permease protein
MLHHAIKMACRNLLKNRLYSAINILGLAVGLCLCLLIGVFALQEGQVNADLKNVERQYVLESDWSSEGAGVYYTSLGPLAAALQANYPDLVSNYYRFSLATALVSSAPERVFKEELQIGDSSLISMFGFTVLHGRKNSAFPTHGVVITATMAKKLFGQENALGKVLTIRTNEGEALPLTVTAVLADLPFTSITHFAANPTPNQLFLPMELVEKFSGQRVDRLWDFKYMVSIVELAPGVQPADLQQPLHTLLKTHAPQEISQTLTPVLRPLRSYYLDWADGKARTMIGTLGLIALFVLLLATANFVSMMITKSSGRLREIGIRRLLGEGRRRLLIQFLTESSLIALLSLLLALAGYQLAYVPVGLLLGKALPPVWEYGLLALGLAVALALLIGVLAGLYPALRLSGIRLSAAVKGKISPTGEGRLLRQGLITIQLMIALFVLIASVGISRQFMYLQAYPLGYEKENILVISSVPRAWNEEGVHRLRTVRHELEQLPGVVATTASYEVPDGNAGNRFPFFAPNDPASGKLEMPLLKTDEAFASTYGLQMASGVFFTAAGSASTANQLVINETAARKFGWQPATALGKQLSWEGNDTPFTVVGVVKDFNFYTLSESMSPLAIMPLHNWNMYRYLSVKIRGENPGHVAGLVEAKWAQLYPGHPFDYRFMEDTVAQFYATESRLLRAFRFANAFTFLITGIGMAAFMSFSLLMRRKELGVRLVLGASKASLVMLYLREFSLHFVIAFLAAFSLVYLFLDRWLESFYYRIQPPLLEFAGLGLLVLGLVVLLIALHVLRVSGASLMRALKAD